jgi:hypothetical protein
MLGSLHLIVSVAIHGAIVLGAAAAGAVVMRRLRGLWAGRAMAAGIAAVAVWMAWATRG